MAQSLASTLSSLRDVDGIIGSFVVDTDGVLLAQDLPAYFAGVAEEVGPRVLRLCDALSLSEGTVSTCTVRYTNHKLSLRSMQGALLAVITSATVNAPSLRMAMNLVARKCAALDRGGAEPVSSTSPPPSVAPPSIAPPSVAPASSGLRALSSMPPAPAAIPQPSPNEQVAPPETHRSFAGTPEGDVAVATRKERALFFRGKRIG